MLLKGTSTHQMSPQEVFLYVLKSGAKVAVQNLNCFSKTLPRSVMGRCQVTLHTRKPADGFFVFLFVFFFSTFFVRREKDGV